jgi:hypothetical protein
MPEYDKARFLALGRGEGTTKERPGADWNGGDLTPLRGWLYFNTDPDKNYLETWNGKAWAQL